MAMTDVPFASLKDGVYIHSDSGVLYTLSEWLKRSDKLTASSVVLVTDSGMLEIVKKDLSGTFNFEDAQEAAASYGAGFRCATRREAIEMYDARVRGLGYAFIAIGGEPAVSDYWTCEVDPAYSSSRSFIYKGLSGDIMGVAHVMSFAVRPVRSFRRVIWSHPDGCR